MSAQHEYIKAIEDFKQKDKFSDDAWNRRGLLPSSQELCRQLTLHFNTCADNLLNALNQQKTVTQLISILKKSLHSIDKYDYDTEEREFISDLYFELAQILDINPGEILDNWLYDPYLAALLNKNREIIETLKQPCTGCKIDLESHIMQKEKGIPEMSWLLVKCSNCSELNLLSTGPDIMEMRFGNYEKLEFLRKDEYSYEEVLAKLAHLKSQNN